MAATKFQVTNTGQEQLIDGSVSSPALTFLSDTATGMYHSAPNTLDFASGGSHSLQIDSSLNLNVFGGISMMTSGKQILAVDGTNLAPVYAFSSSPSSGMYWNGSQVAITQTGVARVTIDTSGLHMVSAGTTQITSSNGTLGIPSFSFNSDIHTGMYLPTTSTLSFVTASTEAIHIDSSQNVGIGGSPITNGILTLTSTSKAFVLPRMTSTQEGAIGSPAAGMMLYNTTSNQIDYYTGSAWTNLSTGTGVTYPILAPNGTASAPSYSFSGSSNTGMYSSGSSLLDFAAGGVQVADMSSAKITTTVPMRLPDTGSNTAPQLQIGAANNGIFTGIATRLGITCNGTTMAQLDATFFQLLNGVQFVMEQPTNQILFDHGGLGNITITAPAAAASRTYTIPDTGTITSNFLMTDGAQTVNGSKYFATQQTFINGNSSTPTIAWNAETNSGFYFVTGGQWGATTQGTLSTYFTVNGLQANTGTASNPGYAFAADTSTGMYRSAASTISWATGGTQRMLLNTTSLQQNVDHVPISDITNDNGNATHRWLNIWGQTIHSGDIELENKWKITEGDKVGHPEEGVMLLSPDGKKFKISMTEVD